MFSKSFILAQYSTSFNGFRKQAYRYVSNLKLDSKQTSKRVKTRHISIPNEAYEVPDTLVKTDQLLIIDNFITVEEEKQIIQFLIPHLKKRRYMSSHWDDVIYRYKEIEFPPLSTNHENVIRIVKRVEDTINMHFGPNHISKSNGKEMSFLNPQVIDIASDGHIGPHIDSLKFSGSIICSLNLFSSRVLRLLKTLSQELIYDQSCPQRTSKLCENNDNTLNEYCSDANLFTHAINDTVTITPPFETDMKPVVSTPVSVPLLEVKLLPRSLYIITDEYRYEYTHEIIGKHSKMPCYFTHANANTVQDDMTDQENVEEAYKKRISVIFRDVLA